MKKLLALLLSVIMTLSICACTDEKKEDSTDATEVLLTLPTDVSEVKKLSAKITVTALGEECTGDMKMDLESEELLAVFELDQITGTLCVTDGKIYMLEESEGGLPRGTVKDVPEEESLSAEQLTTLVNIFLNKEDFTMEQLEVFDSLSGLELGLAMYGITVEQVETAVNTVIDLIHDERWQAEHITFSTQTEGDDTTFTLQTDVAKTLISLITEAAKVLGMEDKLDLSAEIPEMSLEISCKLTRNIPLVVSLSYTDADEEYSLKFEFSDFNNTVIDTEETIQRMAEAHGDYTECALCGSEELYFQGYCELCAGKKFCQNYCGNDSGDDGYCDDCRIPCAGGCGYHADHEEGYCFDCYYEVYCYEDCGKKATHFTDAYGSYAYCDECYEKWELDDIE